MVLHLGDRDGRVSYTVHGYTERSRAVWVTGDPFSKRNRRNQKCPLLRSVIPIQWKLGEEDHRSDNKGKHRLPFEIK